MPYTTPQLLKDITPGTASTNIGQIYPFKNNLYFDVANTNGGSDIWTSNGTDTGTTLVKKMGKMNPIFLTNLSGLSQPLFLIQQDDGKLGTPDTYQLWKTNGTATGTNLVKDLGKWKGYSPFDIHDWNNKVYFKSAVYDPITQTKKYELWQTDGTATGTKLMKKLGSNQPKSIFDQIQNNQNLYFTTVVHGNNYQLWKTNGTATGTTRVKNLGKWSEYYEDQVLADWNGKVYFTSAVYDSTTRTKKYELWETDGTATGTKLIKKLGINKPKSIYTRIEDNQNLYFSTVQGNDKDSIPDTYQLWKTDGTTTGTTQLKNLGKWDYFLGVDDWNGKVYFPSAVYNPTTQTNNYELWQTDGTTTGTKLVKRVGISKPLDGFNNYYNDDRFSDDQNLYFMTIEDDDNDLLTPNTQQLWKTDGTGRGTTLIKDLGKSADFLNLSQVLYPWNGKFYFVSKVYNSTTQTDNYELWQTNGTTTGTKLMKKLGINKPEGTWNWMSDDQNLYIRTVQDDNNWETPDTYQLWKTNGTTTGTRLVKNLGKWQYYVSQSGGEFDYYNKNADYWNGKLYFTSAVYNSTTQTNKYELWQTDGTVTGTKFVKSFGEYQPNLRGPDDGTNRYFTAVKDDGNSQTNDPRQLWQTDGTTTGTKLVQNLGRVDQYSLGKYLNDHYFYEANTNAYGNELWKLPFTEPSTRSAIENNREPNYDPLLEGGLAEKIISLADQSDIVLPPELQPNHLHNLLRMTMNSYNSGDLNQMALDELRTKLSQVQELLPLNVQDSLF